MNHAFGSLSLLEGQTQDQVFTANSNSARMACMGQTNLRSSSRAPKLQRTMGGNLASAAAAHRLRSIRTEKLSVGVHGSAQNQSNTGGYRYENEKNSPSILPKVMAATPLTQINVRVAISVPSSNITL